MGTDWLQLFDKKLCDEILCLNSKTLAGFVERHRGQFGEFSIFQHDIDAPFECGIQGLLEDGETETSLRTALIDELCFSRPVISLDYWGCYVEVFASADPQGAIADYKLLPEREQQNFLLLLPNHVDSILESLDRHRTELTVMTDADIDLLRQWRNICSADPSHMVAYVFDA